MHIKIISVHYDADTVSQENTCMRNFVLCEHVLYNILYNSISTKKVLDLVTKFDIRKRIYFTMKKL